jgi:hypothetical protein
MSRTPEIGFSQPVKLAWLDLTTQRLSKGESPAEIRRILHEFLSDKLAVNSTAKSSVRQKAVSILLKIWVNVPQPIESLRDNGLILLKRLPESNHIAVHWGMAIAIYPFFAMLAEHVGRLLRLQEEVTMAQILKRVRERMGDREGVVIAARKVIRCWVDWGILKDTNKKGIYVPTEMQTLQDAELTTWLFESVLIATGSPSAVLDTLINYTPALFPFKLSSNYFIPNERLEMFNQGVSEASVTFNRRQ